MKNIEIAEPTGISTESGERRGIPMPVQFLNKTEQGLVNAGSLVSFTNGISSVHKSDVMYSTLLAQLAADKKYDRRENTTEWYKYYVNVLGKVGWIIQNVKFEEYSTNSQTLRASTAILDTIKDIVSRNELTLVEKTLSSLQTRDNEAWWVVFDEKSSSRSQNGNFQTSLCNVDSSGQVTLSLCSFYFHASKVHERWLWFDYNSADISFFKNTQVSILNEEAYSKVRQQVIDKVGDNAKIYYGDLNV